MNKQKKILVLSPHTDDGEFGCGGTISRYIDEGHIVNYVAFSDCQESVPDGFPKDILGKEMEEAVTRLGVDKERRQLLDYKVRYFNFDRQRLLEDMVRLNKSLTPDIVFIPCTKDIHQDHATVSQEAIRAFKRCTILGYEFPWNLLELPSTMFVEISEKNLRNKISAIEAYQSQAGRQYSDPQYIRALAITRGKRIFVQYAEVFEVIRKIERL